MLAYSRQMEEEGVEMVLDDDTSPPMHARAHVSLRVGAQGTSDGRESRDGGDGARSAEGEGVGEGPVSSLSVLQHMSQYQSQIESQFREIESTGSRGRGGGDRGRAEGGDEGEGFLLHSPHVHAGEARDGGGGWGRCREGL